MISIVEISNKLIKDIQDRYKRKAEAAINMIPRASNSDRRELEWKRDVYAHKQLRANDVMNRNTEINDAREKRNNILRANMAFGMNNGLTKKEFDRNVEPLRQQMIPKHRPFQNLKPIQPPPTPQQPIQQTSQQQIKKLEFKKPRFFGTKLVPSY